MQKFIVALGYTSALLVCGSAVAESIQGRWVSSGYAEGGSQYIVTVFFAENGRLEYLRTIAAESGTFGSEVTRCGGTYQFDGQSLQTRGTCENGMPLQLDGPVQSIGRNTINISGEIFQRRYPMSAEPR
jgi:hypothetical protein